METYDVIIVGVGAMGAAAAYHCAKRGAKVLALDARTPHHEQGSSHGATRAIREAYFESPDYVPLVQSSYDLWQALEEESGASLLDIHGGLYIGPEGHRMLDGVVTAAQAHGLEVDCLSASETMARFRGFSVPEGYQAVVERRAGVIQAPASFDAHIALARRLGAEIRFESPVRTWTQESSSSVTLEAAGETYGAGAVILTLGPWTCERLSELGLPIAGRRITVVHLEPSEPAHYNAGNYSVFAMATPGGLFAGFPHIDGEGVKVMRHDDGEVCTPDNIRREVLDSDTGEVQQFADQFMPDANGGIRKALTCIYTMTPDDHFIIDRHPGFNNIYYATGFSGHGFKFVPVIGEIMADLALTGTTAHPIDFLSAGRFS